MKKHILKTIFTLSFCIVQATSSVFANDSIYKENIQTKVIMDGLTYKEIEKITTEGFLDIHILEYDLNNPNIKIDILRNNEEWSKRVPLTTMATSNTLAGINASFFDTASIYADILGFELSDGQVVYAKNNYNRTEAKSSSLNQNKDGTISFGYISNQIKFETENGTTVYIDTVNGMQSFDNPVVFTGNVIQDTTYVDSKYDLYKVIVENGQVVQIVPPKTVATLNENQIALITTHSYIVDVMPVGTGIIYEPLTNVGDKISEYELILSGGGNLLIDGEIVNDGIQVYPNLRVPRSAVGTTEDNKLITVVVDGRGTSIGATHNEVANILIEQGVTNAIMLDGGGSSEMMAINHNNVNVVQNSPSDGKERNISNGLGFVSTVSNRSLAKIELKSDYENVFLGSSINLSLLGYDEYNRPIYIDDKSGNYTITGINADIDGNKITPLTAGIGLIEVTYNDLQAQIPINVVDDAKDVVLQVQNKINTNGNTKITGYVTSHENKTMPFQVSSENIKLINSEMGYIKGDTFYSTGEEGVAYIQSNYAGIIKEVAVEVINPLGEGNLSYSLNNSFSLSDNKYIEQQLAKNLMLNEVILFGGIDIKDNASFDKVVQTINDLGNDATLRIFSGGIATPKGMSLERSELYRNKFSSKVYDDLNTKIINLQNVESTSANINQIFNLEVELNNNSMQNVIIQHSTTSYNYLSNSRLNEFFKELLNNYAKSTGYNVYVVNGNSDKKNININNINNITYIEAPKLQFDEESETTLSNDMYFYLDIDGTLKYSFKK